MSPTRPHSANQIAPALHVPGLQLLWPFLTCWLSLSTLLCVICISIGQIMFKIAAALPVQPEVIDWVLNRWSIASLALYGLTTLGWIWILRPAPLHLAYPVMGLAFLIVPMLAWLFLGEPLDWLTLAGGALIMAGVMLASTH